MNSRDPEIYCSDLSRLAGEPLFGTATQITTWFLLEYDGRWDSKAVEKSSLSEDLKAHLNTPADARIGLIRQRPRLAPSGIVFYAALIREQAPVLYRFTFDQLEDLLALDLLGVQREEAAYDSFKTADPLYLVCTNGRRDACCARYGVATYEQMREFGGAAVWQTTHIGGHRFAANVICLPHGISYGRVEPERAATLIESYRQGHLIPDIYRGRTCYDGPAQAAEYFLRTETGNTQIKDFRLIETHTDDQQRLVRFATADNASYTVRLETEIITTRHSCTDSKSSESTHYRLIKIE